MRIENITHENIKCVPIEELRNMRIRFVEIFDRYFADPVVKEAVNIGRQAFYENYVILRAEMIARGVKFLWNSPLDKDINNRMFKSSIWDLDVPAMGEVAIVPEYVSVGGSFIKSPKDAEDIDIIIRDSEDNRDESFELKVGRLIREQTKKEPHFVYASRGPHSSYIPVFDLILRARDETRKVRVKESIVAKGLTPAQRKECDEETERIKENREKAEWPHKFKPAKYTHPNGHPRCIICGQEERTDKVCRKAGIEKESREYFEALDNWDKNLKIDNAEVIKNLVDGSVLDLGCGTCKILKILSNMEREVAGVDRSDIALGFCKKREIETKRVDLEKEEIPFEDSSFDNVISVHTLEHLESPEKLVKEACRIAKKKVIILSPLGERMDPTHKQEFKELEDFKKCFGEEWDVKKIEETNSAIAVLDISKLKKRGLSPFSKFTPPKPTMAGLTEAFSVEEIWNWAKDKFPLDVEEKLNGFRFIIEKAGDRIRLKTEGDKDRTKQLAPLAEILKKIPDDFIIDCNMGIERDGKALPRIRLMTLMADEPELEEGDVIKATIFDLPYWKEDLHEKPLSERRKSLEAFYNKYLKGNRHFGLTNFIVVKDRKGLEQQFRKLAQLPQSEGILIKTLDGEWDTDGSCETWAKIKREAEIKVIALERHDVKGGNYNYTCGLLPGDSGFGNLTEFRGKKYIDLGKCFNTKIKAEPGDILTMGVEEVIPQEKELQWLGARVLDIDKDRKEPYFVKQAMDIAERANILQKAKEGGIDYKIGDKGKGVLQLHIMGIEEDKIEALKKRSQEAVRARHNPLMLKMLLKGAIGEQGCHIDLRMVREGDKYFEGGEIMTGNLSGLDKLKKLEHGGKLRFGWKVPRKEEPQAETIRGPVDWMDAGKGRIEIFPPGEAGATANMHGAMLLLDSFLFEAIEPQDDHAKKFEFKGNKLIPEGTYLMAYVPVTEAGKRGERVWMISKLKEEKETEKLDLETFRAKGIDEDIANPKKRYRELIADLRYLGNSGFPKLKAGEEWGEWKLSDILKYYAKIVDTLRTIYFPIIPPKLGDEKFNTSYWQCYREAKKHMKSKPPKEDEAKEWDEKRATLIKAAYKGIYLVEPHGEMIASGEKKLIVKIKPLPEDYLNEVIYLCSAGKVYGTVLVKDPKKISQEDFKSLADKHRITEKEAADWGFDKQEELLAYEFKIVDSYDPPRDYHHPSGVQTVISEVRFKKGAMFRITKIDKKQQIVGGVVYEPDEVDTQGDYTDAAEIEKAMHRFMEKYATNSNRIRINHKGRKFFFPVLECFQPEHDTVKGDSGLKAGSWWLMIKVTNKRIWKDIEEGKLTGFSMGGRAKA